MVTVVSMGIGSVVLLIVGVGLHGVPRLGWKSWANIVYLAAINTSLAFTIWNHTLRRLTAMESSIINNTMLIQIALLAWLFLDEALSLQVGVGVALATAGAVLVQLRSPQDSKVDGQPASNRSVDPSARA